MHSNINTPVCEMPHRHTHKRKAVILPFFSLCACSISIFPTDHIDTAGTLDISRKTADPFRIVSVVVIRSESGNQLTLELIALALPDLIDIV